ncbi:MAG: PAS domain S-box protein, partial [Methanoregula sp.]|nr:PAS domain S-box protein [Methanoregula sp.]
RESEAKFRAVIDQSFQFIGLMDTDGTLIVANRSALEFAGLSESDVINQPFWETPWWSHSKELQEKLKDAIHRAASGEMVRFETTHPAADGHLAYIDFSVKPVLDPSGRILFLIPEGRNISERKQAEEALRESEEKFRQLITSAPLPLSIANSKGEIEFVNARFTQLFGYTHAEVPTLYEWFERAYPDKEYRKLVLETWDAAVKRGLENETDIEPAEYNVTCKDGSIRNVIITGITIEGKLLATFIDNTERRKTEEALRESEEKYRALIELSPDAVVVQRDGKIIYVNQECVRLARAGSAEDLIGREVISFIDPEYHQLLMEQLRLMEEGKTIPLVEERFLTFDGSPINVEVTSKRILYEGLPSIMVVFRDITERKRTEVALRESEEKYRTLVEKSQDGIVIVQNERITFVNGALMDMIGHSEGELLGHSVEEFVAPEDAGTVIARHRERMSGREVVSSYEYSLLHKDGSTRVTVKMNAGIATYRGRPAMIATFQNVTLERKREAALRESEKKYRTLVESSFDGIAIHQDGIIVYANRTAARLLGSDDPAVFIGKPAIDLVAPAFRKQIAERIQRSPERELELIREQFVRLDGTPIDVDVTTIPTTWQGRPAAYVTFRDITAQLRAEEALRESEEKYRMLVEQSRDGVFIIQDDRLVFYNKALVGMTGYTAEELDGRLLADLIAPEDRQMVVSRADGRARGKKVPELYEFSLLHKDGVGRTRIRVRAGLGSYKGKPASIGMFYDVTEDRRREEYLRDSETKFRELTELLPQIVFEMDKNMMITFVNRQAYTALGYTPDDIAAGFNALSIIDPSQHGRIRENIAKLVKKEPYEHQEYTFRRKDGSTFPALIYADPMIKDGELAGFRGIIIDISDRKRAEDALRESEEKFRALVESTSDFIWEVDAAGKYTYVSPQVRQILGYEPIELIGKTPFEIMPAGEAERMTVEFNRCVKSRLPIVALENKALKKDGSVVILETSGVVRIAKDGSFQGYRGIDRDITMRKQAEEALRESEARLSSILHGSPVLQFVINRNHRVISWNKALEEYSGIRAAEMVGTDQQWRAFYAKKRPVLADLLVDGDTDAISRLYAGKLRRSRYVEGAFEATDFFPHMGRSGIWLSFTAAPIRDIQGTIIGAVETLEDVTERINAENALRESDTWTRTILNTAQAGIILVDANTHRIVDANRKALELIGLDRDSVIGTVCHRFICPAEEGKCPVTDLDQAVDTSERVLLTASGEKIPVLKTVVHVSMGGRDILVESFVDISEQKRSEDAIREANRKLNLLNSITRHDIRNQLMVAQGYAQLAAFSKPEPVVADFLNKIATAVQTIQRQIEFTKEYQELGVHAPAWFMIRNVISTVRPEKIAVRNTCNSVEIFADPMIDKVFYNLFDNAVKYGERVTTVSIGCEETDRGLVITFADNGVGIPAEEKHKIFEKGYGRNTGFGLFLVREILAITGITIEETGTEGKGAVFEITVPKGVYRKAD